MKLLLCVFWLMTGTMLAGGVHAADKFRLSGPDGPGPFPAPSGLIDDPTRRPPSPPPPPPVAEPVKPLETVLETIRQRSPGRALGARLVEWQGRDAYAIRWIGRDGRVRDILADAVSGTILDER